MKYRPFSKECKCFLQMSDVHTAVQICSLLHQRYAEFSGQLLEHWQKVLPVKKDEKVNLIYLIIYLIHKLH